MSEPSRNNQGSSGASGLAERLLPHPTGRSGSDISCGCHRSPRARREPPQGEHPNLKGLRTRRAIRRAGWIRLCIFHWIGGRPRAFPIPKRGRIESGHGEEGGGSRRTDSRQVPPGGATRRKGRAGRAPRDRQGTRMSSARTSVGAAWEGRRGHRVSLQQGCGGRRHTWHGE